MQCPPRPGPGIERHEAERLGLRGLDHLPDVDAHPVEDHLELVHERDVDRAEDVLEQLRGLGDPARRDRDHLVERGAVERRGGLGGRRRRRRRPPSGWSSCVKSLRCPDPRAPARRRARSPSAAAAARSPRGWPAPPRRWCRDTSWTRARRAGPCRSRFAISRAGRVDVRVVGLAVAAERRRDADHDRVARRRGDRSPSSRCNFPLATAAATRSGPMCLMYDSPRAERLDLRAVHVEAGHREAGFAKHERQRQTDIALTDHAHVSGPVLDPRHQLFHFGTFPPRNDG